jgi:8-oxo-dGTP pyrophosphatase MutT (NUDIX family)
MPTSGGTPLRYGSLSTDPDPIAGIAVLRGRLSGRAVRRIDDREAKRAAVLVPIFPGPEGLQILCFERTHEVLEHKGEICLPGGSIEPQDAGTVEAALREADEELGIPPADVDVLGFLDDVHTTVSNYVISPVVGFIAATPKVVADSLEVARPIAVPVRELIERGVERYELRAPDGSSRKIYAYHVRGDRIWGATARIIHGMLSLWLGGEGDPS